MFKMQNAYYENWIEDDEEDSMSIAHLVQKTGGFPNTMNNIEANITRYDLTTAMARAVARLALAFDISSETAAGLVQSFKDRGAVFVDVVTRNVKDENGFLIKEVIKIEVIY